MVGGVQFGGIPSCLHVLVWLLVGCGKSGEREEKGEEKTWVSKEKVYENTFYIILPTRRLTPGNHPNHVFLGFHRNSN